MTDPASPVDEQLAAQMALLADGFVRGAAAEGLSFSYDLDEADRLDPLVDLFLASEPAPGPVHSMALTMGACVGELLVRADLGGWEWGVRRSKRPASATAPACSASRSPRWASD